MTLTGLVPSVLAGRQPNDLYLEIIVDQSPTIEVFNGPDGPEPCKFRIGKVSLMSRSEWTPSRHEPNPPWSVA